MLLVLAQVLSCSLLGSKCGHKKRDWQMSAIYLGIANEVETAGSQSQPMLLILVATTLGCHCITVQHVHKYK
jgi:hypothetical protein